MNNEFHVNIVLIRFWRSVQDRKRGESPKMERDRLTTLIERSSSAIPRRAQLGIS